MTERPAIDLPDQREPHPTRTSGGPYNFVPLPRAVVPAVASPRDLPDHDTFAHDAYPLTGYFHVELTTRTPLYTRCAVEGDLFDLDEAGRDRHGHPIGPQTLYADRVKNTPAFFHLAHVDQPVIPGSVLRGMLRSLVEIVSHGKFTHFTDDRLVYRAVADTTALGAWYRYQFLGANQATWPDMHFEYPLNVTPGGPRVAGGYLEVRDGEWWIRPAVTHHGESFVHVDYANAGGVIGQPWSHRTHDVWVEPAIRVDHNHGLRNVGAGQAGNLTLRYALSDRVVRRRPGQTAPAGLEWGILVESGHLGSKHMHCVIYAPDWQAQPLRVPRPIRHLYEDDRELSRGTGPRATRKLGQHGQPLFYLLDDQGELVFFGPTMMFRLPYERSIGMHVPDPLKDDTIVDFADAIFGFVRQSRVAPTSPDEKRDLKEQAYAGRVSFTPAQLVEPVPPDRLWLLASQEPALTPRILGAPKPTSFQHYLVQRKDQQQDLSFYDSPARDAHGQVRGEQTVVRGYKRYWPQGSRTRPDIEAVTPAPNSTQHTCIKPVAAGVTFAFDIHFENLRAAELGALCWALCPPAAAGQDLVHHLGLGKPLGLGVVKLAATLHVGSREARYDALFDDEGSRWVTGFEQSGAGLPLTDTTVQRDYVRPFERAVLTALGQTGAGARLAREDRIDALLTLMQWRAPLPRELMDAFRTREFADFRVRRVLPTPQQVVPPVAQLVEPPPPPPLLAPVVSRMQRERVTVVTATQTTALVETQDGDQIPCSSVPAYTPLVPGQRIRAEVTREDGKATRAVFKSLK